MSATKPPQHLLERMGRGRIAELSSIACLAGAVGVKRGRVTGLQDLAGDLTPEEQRSFLEVVERARQMFIDQPEDEVQAAIDLYTAHLRWLGLAIEMGVTN